MTQPDNEHWEDILPVMTDEASAVRADSVSPACWGIYLVLYSYAFR
jgi:hypothetical protein